MKLEYMGNGVYRGTLNRHNGASLLYGKDLRDIVNSLIAQAFGKEKQTKPLMKTLMGDHYDEYFGEPTYRKDEEAWTNDDWERDFVQTEVYNNHKDDDKI